jgi:CheY-like chemotaxis protein
MPASKICMLIDDDVDDHYIFRMALEEVRTPIILISEYDGVVALQRLRGDSMEVPDVIFLDLNMPRMSGRECLIELKKIRHLEKVAVVIYSTSSEIRDLLDAQALGATAYVIKSPNIGDLTMALDDFFSGSEPA